MQARKTTLFIVLAAFLLTGLASAKQSSKSTTRPARSKDPISAKTARDAGAGGRIGPTPEINWGIPDTSKLVRTGDEFAMHGAWQEARRNYQEVLTLEPTNDSAIYGLARCAGAVGDVKSEIGYFRRVIYAHDPSHHAIVSGESFQGGDPDKLMEYVVLLSQTGQDQEALFVYRRAADLLNYENERPILKVLLPELVAERTLPAQVRYTPERLQALAKTAMAHEESGHGYTKEALAHIREAVKLYPDSPVTNYYLGEELLGTDDRGAKAAYQKAAELGDDHTLAAAKERIETCQ